MNKPDKEPLLPPLSSHSGTGILRIEGKESIDVEFTFEQHHDAKLLLICTYPIEIAWQQTGLDAFGGWTALRSFEGTTDDNWRLDIPKLALSLRSSHDGKGYAEFPAFEATYTPLDAGGNPRKGKPHFLRVPLASARFSPELMGTHTFANGFQVKGQQLPLRLGNQELTICYQRDDEGVSEIMKEHRMAGVVSDAFLPMTALPDKDETKEILAVLCSLLTFTLDTRVNWLGYDVCDSDGRILQRFCIRTATDGYRGDYAGQAWSAVPWIDSMPQFLETAYARYQQLWDDWDIYALITLFTELRGVENQYLELTGLYLCSCIEMLNRAYKNRVGDRTFKKALEEICQAVGLTVEEADLKRVLDNRNALMHEGLLRIPDSAINPNDLRPRERWDWYDTKAQERDRELYFLRDFIGTLLFCALGGNKVLIRC